MKYLKNSFIGKQAKEFYKSIRNERKQHKENKTIFCKNKTGYLVGGIRDILERWMEYFKEVFGVSEIGVEDEVSQPRGTSFTAVAPAEEDIRKVIKTLKRNRLSGENGIAAEMLKAGGEILVQQLYNIGKRVWIQDKMPTRCKESLIYPTIEELL
ncbi:hypothetical protein QE152_g32577 [Popillia japonica]|uniref:Uncharacterized protein n=1 Tax=Popillia japonica TaxID=7064 RepID=A0AAW1IYL0_POPJA